MHQLTPSITQKRLYCLFELETEATNSALYQLANSQPHYSALSKIIHFLFPLNTNGNYALSVLGETIHRQWLILMSQHSEVFFLLHKLLQKPAGFNINILINVCFLVYYPYKLLVKLLTVYETEVEPS